MDKDKEYVELKKKNEGLIHISYSEFSKYMECGHKHLVEKYLNLGEDTTSIHLLFGNAIHSTIEMGLKKSINMEQRIEHFNYTFSKDMMDNNNLLTIEERKLLNDFLTQGAHLLRLLSTEKILEKYELIGVEEPIYENLYEIFHFKGFIDLIVRDRKTKRYVIIDWKTSSEEWDVSKKKKDKIFMSQMRFYKFFYSRKHNIPIDMIDCKYVVLNRLVSRKDPKAGFGKLQPVEIFSTQEEIDESINMVKEVVRKIHTENIFEKAKLNNKKGSCFFCPLKNNPTLCNSNPEQYKELLSEHKK